MYQNDHKKKSAVDLIRILIMSSIKTCEFSELLEQSGGLVQFSPLCETSPSAPAYIASVSGNRLTIRDAQSLQSTQVFSCIDKVDRMEWSPDGLYVACILLMRAAVQVFCVADTKWTCRINEGVAGLICAKWSPNSRHIILESDFGIQLSIWSLMSGSSQLIMHPKQNTVSSATASPLIAFSPCGRCLKMRNFIYMTYSFNNVIQIFRFLAIGLRIDLQDFIGVYGVSTAEWTELVKFKCKGGGNNLSSICWAPDGSHIIAADSHLSYRLAVYTPSGEVVATYEAYQNALGIKQVLSQTSVEHLQRSIFVNQSLVAVGSFDGIVRILSPLSWKLAFELPLTHPKEMQPGLTEEVSPCTGVERALGIVVTTVEVADPTSTEIIQSTLTTGTASAYVSRNLKMLPHVNPDPNCKGPPKFGVCGLVASPDCTFLAAREESYPRCLWIWDMRLILNNNFKKNEVFA